MSNKYFDFKDTLYDITSKYSEAIDLLYDLGFKYIKDEKKIEILGKAISLEMALNMKKIDKEYFENELVNKIKENKIYDVTIKGILPCPVRIPLVDAFEEFLKDKEDLKEKISYELKAASMGVDWLVECFEKSDAYKDLPDLFISAGFDLFFDKNLMGQYKSEFEDFTLIENYNKDFENHYIKLKDPDNEYSMLGVVPAVFLVNKEELGDIEMPTSWKDLFKDEFKNKVSLPIGDFDLFNAILLNIYKTYGTLGVEKLGESLLTSMHPSQMVKSHKRKTEKPIVTIMPYFFTKMVNENGPMAFVWPKDGAIISPIFMLSKKDKKEKLKPIVDFFSSKKVGEILAHNGKFPSIHPDVDNRIPKENKYMFLGWDYIKNNDIKDILDKCEKMFYKGIKEE